MLDKMLSFVAPHHCYSCGEIGQNICISCKNDIINEPYLACVACGVRLAVGSSGVCELCRVPYSRAWCVSTRELVLKSAIDGLKFSNNKSVAADLAMILAEILPNLPEGTVLVPVPSIEAHVRQRGYDHVGIIVAELSKLKNTPVMKVLNRKTSSRQLGASRQLRLKQAREAYECNQKLDSKTTYLLLDDVLTTGATAYYCAKTLKNAGAKNIWLATLSRQSID